MMRLSSLVMNNFRDAPSLKLELQHPQSFTFITTRQPHKCCAISKYCRCDILRKKCCHFRFFLSLKLQNEIDKRIQFKEKCYISTIKILLYTQICTFVHSCANKPVYVYICLCLYVLLDKCLCVCTYCYYSLTSESTSVNISTQSLNNNTNRAPKENPY